MPKPPHTGSPYPPLTLNIASVICERAFQAISVVRNMISSNEIVEDGQPPRLRPRLFNAVEVAALAHTPSRSTIQDRLLNDPNFPKGTQEGRNRRRYFSLGEINQMRDILGLRPTRLPGQRARVISVSNFKGGAGKTTSAVNIAEGLAIRGYRVALIDMDAQASATAVFGLQADGEVNEEDTVMPWFVGDKATGEFPKSLRYAVREVPHVPGLSIIPAATVLNFLDFLLFQRLQESGGGLSLYPILREGVETIRDDFDVIIIDCPPNFSFTAVNCLYAADAALMPLPANAIDFDSARKFFDMMVTTYESIFGRDEAARERQMFEWFSILITRNQPSSKQSISGSDVYTSLTRDTYSPLVSEATFMHTKVLEGDTPSTVYGHHPYSGKRETYLRAFDVVERIVDNVEGYLKHAWAADTASQKKVASGSAA